MYGAIWRAIPGPKWLRAFLLLAVFAGIVYVLFEYVFPWLAPLMPFSDQSVSDGSTPTP